MNWKRAIGGLVALVGGYLLWRWWQTRGSGSAPAADALGTSIGQVGAQIREDSTPEVVNAVLAYSTAATQAATCWVGDGANDGVYYFRQPSTGMRIAVPAERLPFEAPTNICGRA